MKALYRLIEAFKAWRRGEVRIAPRGVRGRVYAKAGGVRAKARPEAKMSMRVWRKEEKCWYRRDAKTGAWERE